MSKINDGGPVFPHPDEFDLETAEPIGYAEGMSLRTYLAAKFAAAWVVTLGARHGQKGYSDAAMLGEANRRGIEQADDMIERLGP